MSSCLKLFPTLLLPRKLFLRMLRQHGKGKKFKYPEDIDKIFELLYNLSVGLLRPNLDPNSECFHVFFIYCI
jgi:hypothetical protein